MPRSFNQTTRSLQNDRYLGTIVLFCIGLFMLALWGGWFLKSKITVQKKSVNAQIIQSSQISILSSPTGGTVSKAFFDLGELVKKGELIVELDHELIDANLLETKNSLLHINTQLDTYYEEYTGFLEAQANESQRLGDLITSMEDELVIAKATVATHEKIINLYEQLKTQNQGSELDLLNAILELKKSKAGALSIQADIVQSRSNLANVLKLQKREKMQLLQKKADLEKTQIQVSSINLRNIVQLQQHYIRAPSSGYLAAIPIILEGQFINKGEKIGVINSDSSLRINANFMAADAIGHIKVGQKARVKLDGFEWTKYGTILAEVTKVARSIHDGYVRVELEILETPVQVSLLQGMPVSVDVIVDMISPYSLVLRATANWAY